MADATRRTGLRAFTVILATIVPLAVVGGLLVSSYHSSREASLVARTYRHLRSIGEQMATTIKTQSEAVEKVAGDLKPCLRPSPAGGATVTKDCAALAKLLDGTVVESLGFDEVVLTGSERDVLTTWGRARVAIRSLDELGPGESCAAGWWSGKPATPPDGGGKAAKAGGTASPLERSERRTICWLDRAFLLFSVPVALDGYRILDADGQPLWLHGLVDSERFGDDSWRLPYVGIVTGSLLLLLLLLSWPMLRLWTLGARERLRAVDLSILGVCLVAAAGLATIGLLAATSESRSRRNEDVALRRLAGEVRDRFRREVFDSIDQLDAFQRVERSSLPRSVPLTTTHLMGMSYVDNEGEPLLRLTPTPGSSGIWKTTSYAGEQPSVQGRPYFVDAQRQNLWRLRGEQGGQCRRRGARASVEIVRSKLTSKLTLVVARPLSWHPGRKIDVILASTDLRPFNPPSLPLGYGYAIVADDGMVQLHSNTRRSLIENFFEETEHDPVVKARVHSDSPVPFGMKYLGEDYRAIALPLAAAGERIPWTIVAFREREILRTTTKESLLASGVIFMAWIVSCVIALLCLHLFMGSGRAEWLWPHRGTDGARFYAVASVLLLLVGGMALGLASRLAESGFVLLLAVPIVTMVMLYAWLRRARGDEPARVHSEAAFRVAYACFLTALVAILGVLPAVAAYSDARSQAEHDLRTYENVVRADRRAERLRRIDKNRLRDPTWVIQERVADTCDVYEGLEPGGSAGLSANRFTPRLRDWLPLDATGAALLRAVAWHAGPAPAAVGMGQVAVVALVIVSVLGVLLWAGSPSVFLLDADRETNEAPRAPGIVRWCFERSRGWQRRPAVVLDLREPPSAMPEWVRRRSAAVPADAIEVRHVHAWLGDATARDLLRELLERLVAADVGVRLESDVDLRQALAAEIGDSTAGAAVTPWAKVLAAFAATREFLDVDTALADADDERQSLHQSLWDRLSGDEQRTLWQLAREGFINPRGVEATKSLFRKGLVRRNGALHVATPGLRSFVLRTVTPDVVAKWEDEGADGGWDRRPLSAAVGLGAIFLLYTQPDFFNSTVATIGSVTVAIPTLLRVFSMLGEGKSAPTGAT